MIGRVALAPFKAVVSDIDHLALFYGQISLVLLAVWLGAMVVLGVVPFVGWLVRIL